MHGVPSGAVSDVDPLDGSLDGSDDVVPDGTAEGCVDGLPDGTVVDSIESSPTGWIDGTPDGSVDGKRKGMLNITLGDPGDNKSSGGGHGPISLEVRS